METIPIKMKEGKNISWVCHLLRPRFLLCGMWQCLDQSPQSKIQLTQAIVSSWSIKKASAGPNPIKIAAVAAKFWTPPTIEPVAHRDKKDCDPVIAKKMDVQGRLGT